MNVASQQQFALAQMCMSVKDTTRLLYGHKESAAAHVNTNIHRKSLYGIFSLELPFRTVRSVQSKTNI